MPADIEPVRQPVVAGQFYPGSPDALRKEVDRFLERAKRADLGPQIVALVAPHAGYLYSGATAAEAYRQVQGQTFDAVIVIAPSHRDAFRGVSLMPKGGYATPLGALPIHEEIAARLLESGKGIYDTPLGHGAEHAVEVQLPFIQRALGSVPIVPTVMMDRSWETCRALAEALVEATKEFRVLVVASSDLYHGYSEAECRATDEVTLRDAESGSAEAFCRDLEAEKVQACGGGPIAVAKEYARLRGAFGARVLAHATSADALGKGEGGGYVVGYGALAYYSTSEAPKPEVLSENERQTLIDLARATIRAVVTGSKLAEIGLASLSPALREPRGAFVTIRRQGNLRGCIGAIYPDAPLAETVVQMAESASLRDPRFLPMTTDELADSLFEISVLTPPRKLGSPDEVVVGKHGLLISGRGRRGVLLPQVPVEQGWDRETFLRQVCLKAGLPSTAWRDRDITLEAFAAEVFGDEEPIAASQRPT